MAQRPGGVGIYTCDDVTVIVDTKTCPHCTKIVDIPNMRKLTDYADICRQCNTIICLECVGKPCVPWQKRIEEIEREFYRRQQFSRSLGCFR